jgi:hypothetical protein
MNDCRSGHIIIWYGTNDKTGTIAFQCRKCKRFFIAAQEINSYTIEKSNHIETFAKKHGW